MKRTFTNSFGDFATIEFNGHEWFVCMGCSLWSKYYKSEKCAVNYLIRNGYAEVI